MDLTSPPRALLLLLGAIALAGCSGDHDAATAGAGTSANRPLQPDPGPSAGGQDAAAGASFLASAGATVLHGNRPRFVSTLAVADKLAAAAAASLRAWALESGAGPHLVWSSRTERLALAPDAPKDANANGTNQDETLAAEWAKCEEVAEGKLPAGIWPSFALFNAAEPRFAQPVDLRNRKTDFTSLRWDRSKAARNVSVAGLGAETHIRMLRAQKLLAERRGNAAGMTPEEGLLGLLYLQQALAADELLLNKLIYDGAVLGSLRDPDTYDPVNGLRWFPSVVTVIEEPQQKGLPPKAAAFEPVEPASELATQAALLQGISELAWMAAPNQTNPNYRDLFQGRPFGDLPGKNKGKVITTTGPVEEITWETHIKGLLNGPPPWACRSCHPNNGGFNVTTYQTVLFGGDHRATNPTVVPGNAEGSLLWQVLALPRPPVSRRMPDGGPFLSVNHTDVIKDWINQGAKEKPSAPAPPPAVPGRGVARVIVRNLNAMHRDPAGVLVDRHDGKTRSVHVGAAAAGDALTGLVCANEVIPDEPALLPLLRMEADFVAANLVRPTGEVIAGFTLGRGADPVPATLEAQASVTHGLFEAARVTGAGLHRDAALRAGNFLLERFWRGVDLFDTTLGSKSRVYTPDLVGKVLAALRALKDEGGVAEAGNVHDQFASRMLADAMVLAEWDEAGELIGDGDPDTNKNGIVEAPLAGGPHGTSTVFAGRMVAGPPVEQEALSRVVSWSKHVQPLFRLVCTQCHLGTANQGKYRLETHQEAFQHGESGGRWPMIVPGSPESSLLFLKLDRRYPPVGVQMPQALPPLSASGRALVAEWIRQGALNN